MDLGLVLRSRAACGAPGDTHAPPNDGVALQSVRRLLALACDAVRHMSQCRNGLVHSVPCPPALACSALSRDLLLACAVLLWVGFTCWHDCLCSGGLARCSRAPLMASRAFTISRAASAAACINQPASTSPSGRSCYTTAPSRIKDTGS